MTGFLGHKNTECDGDDSDTETNYSGIADACCDGDETGKFICKSFMWACGVALFVFTIYALSLFTV